MRLKTMDLGFIVSLIIISIVSLDLILNESHREIIENISKYPPFQNFFTGLLIINLILWLVSKNPKVKRHAKIASLLALGIGILGFIIAIVLYLTIGPALLTRIGF